MADSDDKAKRDANRVPTIIGVSSQDTTIAGKVFVTGVTPVPVAVNPSTNKIILEFTEE